MLRRSTNGTDDMWCSSEPRLIPASSLSNIDTFDVVPRHPVSAARFICLECEPDPEVFCTWVMFCDDERCYNSTQAPLNVGVPPHKCAHDVAHDLVKVRTVVHRLAWGPLRQKARDALRYLPWNPAPPDPLAVKLLADKGGPSEARRQDMVDPVKEVEWSPKDYSADSAPSSPNSSPRSHHRDLVASSPQLGTTIDHLAAEDKAMSSHECVEADDGQVQLGGLNATILTEDEPLTRDEIHGPDITVPSHELSEEDLADTLPVNRHVPDRSSPSVDDSQAERVTCYICRKEVLMEGCWYCIDCTRKVILVSQCFSVCSDQMSCSKSSCAMAASRRR